MSPEDRPRAIRKALRNLVAENGFHGASMSAVANQAGVATGTAYVHYESKDELVYATYLEIKSQLAEAVLEDFDPSGTPYERYNHLFVEAYRYLAEEPERARFLTQMEESPYYEEARARVVEAGDRLMEAAGTPEVAELLVELPKDVIYAMSLGVAVRLIAAGTQLKDEELELLVDSTWRAVTRPMNGDSK